MWCLEAMPCLEAVSRQIFTALALVQVLEVSVLGSVLSQDRDQDINLQRKMQHNTQ